MENDILKVVGQRIREARKVKDWSQAKLAEASGWPGASTRVSNYEQGIREPGRADIISMAQALDKPALWLGGYDLLMPPDEQALWYKYWGTDERGRLQIHSAADAQPAPQAGPLDPKIGRTG